MANPVNVSRLAVLGPTLLLAVAVPAQAKQFTPWGPPVNAESLEGSSADLNTSSNDGCPILSPYDQSLYIASNRAGTLGGNDLWRAERSGEGWGTPVNLGAPINSAAADYCPSPTRGNRLFFVSEAGNAAGNGDIYEAKQTPKGWRVEKLPPTINSSSGEWSPSLYTDEQGREVLYFSRVVDGLHRIYYSVNRGPAQLAPGGVNSSASDARPNVRHDGLEIVWDSTRAGSLGATDIWTASRNSTSDPWGQAVHLVTVNSDTAESRASLSWDGTMLVFGSARAGGEGAADVYVSRRQKVTGKR